MCGIVGVLARRWAGEVPRSERILADLDRAIAAAESLEIDAVRALLGEVDRPLRSVAGVLAAIADPDLLPALVERLDRLEALIDRADGEATAASPGDDEIERRAAGLVAIRDLCWALRNDRRGLIGAVLELAGSGASVPAVEAYVSIQQTLAAIDRLEVRGRDSAGVHVMVSGHGLDLSTLNDTIRARSVDPLYQSGAVRVAGDVLSFVYKAAAEIGELGDNTRAIREQILADDLLRAAVSGDEARATVLAHTRWASVGVISEANAHPINQEQAVAARGPYVVAALNALESAHPASDFADHALRHARAELAVRPVLVVTHAIVQIDIEHDRRRQGMPTPRQLNPALAVGSAHIGGVDHCQPAMLQPLLGDGGDQFKRISAEGLVVFVVADEAAR